MITTADLIKKVRCVINEPYEDAEVSLLTGKVRSFDDVIKELLSQAVALVQRSKGPKGGYVNVKRLTSLTGLLMEYGDGTGYMCLPDDYVELVCCKLDKWKRPCTVVQPARSPEADRQYNAVTRSGCQRPVCVEGIMSAGSRTIEFFPLPGGAKVEDFFYEAKFDVNEGLNRCDKYMIDAVVYACASLLYNMFERYDAAKSFMSFAMAFCNGNAL